MPRANILDENASALMDAWTFLRVLSDTTPRLFNTLETVPTETPACCATSLIVAWRLFCRGRGADFLLGNLELPNVGEPLGLFWANETVQYS